MPSKRRANRIQRIWSLLTTGRDRASGQVDSPHGNGGADSKETGIEGSQDALDAFGGYSRMHDYMLDLPESPRRPVCGSLATSTDLMELATWSREGRDVGSYLSRDVFMEMAGKSGSWSIAKESVNGRKTNPDIVSIGENLASRRSGKELILGGTRLKRAVSESAAFYGDSFLEIAIEVEGISRKDYGISNSLYLPPLGVFVDQTVDGRLNGYWQRERMSPGDDDIFIHPLKMLHFSHEKSKRYGHPLLMQSLPAWRKLKRVAPDLEKAIHETAIAPWLHIMPPDTDLPYKASYTRGHQNMQAQGIVSNLYLANGADVRRAFGANAELKTLVEHWLNLRSQVVPAGFPSYLFPRLATGASSVNKELANQPAAVYARLIADVRAMIGEQVKWAMDLEILLSRGYDFLMENADYDIKWPEWDVVPTVETPRPKGAGILSE